MSRTRAIVSIAASTLLACTLVTRVARADGRSEAAAKDALQKAQSDFFAMNYAGASVRLNKAVQACGAKNCTPLTKGTLLRDLGTMQFRAGDKNAAAKSWGDALTLQPTLALNPDYDASDVGAAWEDARAVAGLPAGPVSSKPPPSSAGAGAPAGAGGTAGAAGSTGARAGGRGAAPPPPPEPMGEQPTGDFVHDPAPEQKEDTPLPIHVEYTGSSTLRRVVVKYKGAQMREWTRIELKRAGEAAGSPVWEGTIPCADVGRGTLRYWVQGFDRAGEPLAATGDPKHPYYVPIRDKITSEPPHLPGKEPPKSCEESDCPPGLPGCKGGKKGSGSGSESAASETGTSAGASEGGGGAAGEEAESEEKKPEGPYRRMWFGVSLDVDYLSLSSLTQVCSRNASSGTALNSGGYYCYDPVAGADFPNPSVNATLQKAGTTTGGFQLGNVRALLAFDYAWRPNVLVGARLGYVFNAYPGTAANHFPPLHIEGRATYLLGRAPLGPSALAPLGFVALGLSEFDGRQSTGVTCGPGTTGCGNNGTIKVVDVWSTDAPFFFALGAGIRYQFGSRVALSAALRVNLVIGGNGLLPTFGPDIGAMYAF